MKKFAQLAVLVVGLAGLSACASDGMSSDYESRTAGGSGSAQLAACQERVARLEKMNKACYRK